MNPAYSVIVFTTASGAGYGLLVWLAWSQWADGHPPSVIALAAALGLVTAGLLSSTLHLGHPERAWRAVSQWRTSWLSREGLAALLVYPLAAAWCVMTLADHPWSTGMAGLTALASAVTVYCTAMIYASLKPIPRWNNPWVAPVYLGFAAATGGLLYQLLALIQGRDASAAVAIVLAAAWLLKLGYWWDISRRPPLATAADATGLARFQTVRLFESPHTQDNYVQREMGFAVARRHASKLRRIASVGAVAAASLVLASPRYSGTAAAGWGLLAIVVGGVSVLIERWLFFAEARHVVNLYYGDEAV